MFEGCRQRQITSTSLHREDCHHIPAHCLIRVSCQSPAAMPSMFDVFRLVTLIGLGQIVHAQSRTDFIKALLEDYDNRVTPTFDEGTPTEVDVSLFINNIDSISEQTMEFSLNAFVVQEWKDKRLEFLGLIDAEYLELDTKLMDGVWVPDLYFSNEKRASFHSVTVPNKMLHLYSDGHVVYKLRVSLTASCPMQLQKYPMDSQMCSLLVQSFAFSKRSLMFKWKDEDPVKRRLKLQLPQFSLSDIETRNCTEEDENGNFTCIAVDFHLQRNIGFYMIQIYIPSMLIVLLSWVSFWLNVDAVPARISLGILTVLTMTTQKSMAISSLPRVSYVKAIDVWMAACLCFVFASLLEFALVNVMDRRQVKRRQAPKDISLDIVEKSPLRQGNSEPVSKWVQDPSGAARAKNVDNVSRVFFPGAFIVFCAVYWMAYSL
ncbi:glycine receptor subunit alpha-2-like isoform X1 [Haliotis cracherodii]|uniref:glycine receptor subunit alpha-2-like isoform X1 n=2 Tax=Haliotis cracherodii TaxID=6455 RepID=UPI0039EB6B77